MLGRDLETNRKSNRSVSAHPYAAGIDSHAGFTVILPSLMGPGQWRETADTSARRLDGCPVTIPFGGEMRIE